jgi:hypothetical protein
MNLKRSLTCAALGVAAVFPTTASAQLQVPPGGGDNVQDAIDLGTLRPSPRVVGYQVDTSNYTLQPELGEFDICGNIPYGKTVWGRFATNRTGRVDITAAGFDGTIGLSRVVGDNLEAGPCTDRLAGRIESFGRDALPTVRKGDAYYVQVGGAQQPDGTIPGGPLEVAVELLEPEVVVGADAGLAWTSTRGGIKVNSVRVDGPRGSSALAFCRKKCGSRVRRNFKPTVFNKSPLEELEFSKRVREDHLFQPASKPKAARGRAFSAAENIMKGRRIRNGRTLFVAVVAQDQIGQIFSWKVRNNVAGAKKIRCIEPASSKIRAVGRCNGR